MASEELFWTTQYQEVWDRAEASGALKADGRRIRPYIRPAYRWMMQQMKERIPGYSGRFPIWAYPDTYKPDLRGLVFPDTGIKGVRVGFTANPDNVLPTKYRMWEDIMGGNYCAITRDEFETDREIGVSGWSNSAEDVDRVAEIRASWDRVFDLSLIPYGSTERTNRVQIVIEQIHLGKIVEVTPFISS